MANSAELEGLGGGGEQEGNPDEMVSSEVGGEEGAALERRPQEGSPS